MPKIKLFLQKKKMQNCRALGAPSQTSYLSWLGQTLRPDREIALPLQISGYPPC